MAMLDSAAVSPSDSDKKSEKFEDFEENEVLS